jgi:hypothetical protein
MNGVLKSGLPEFFVEADGNLAASPRCHERVGLVNMIEGKAMEDEILRMKVPAHKTLDKFHHASGGCDPGGRAPLEPKF